MLVSKDFTGLFQHRVLSLKGSQRRRHLPCQRLPSAGFQRQRQTRTAHSLGNSDCGDILCRNLRPDGAFVVFLGFLTSLLLVPSKDENYTVLRRIVSRTQQ